METELINILSGHKTKAPTVRETLINLGRAGTKKNEKTSTAKITFAKNPIIRKSPYAGMFFNGQGRPIEIDGYSNTLPASMGGNRTPIIDEEFLYGNSEYNWIEKYHKELSAGKIEKGSGEAPSRLRRLTIKEAARIQGFPDNYQFHGSISSVYTQIGNAVPPKLAEVVARSVIHYLEN